MDERRGLQKKCIMELLKDKNDHLVSFRDIVKPLLKNGKTHLFKALKARGIFCDGFSIPYFPFKSLSEAKSFLADRGLDVKMTI
jgi:hypothetical protein